MNSSTGSRDKIALVAMFAFSFAAFLATGLANLSLLIVLLSGSVYLYQDGLRIPRDPQLLLVLAVLIYLPLCALLAPHQPGLNAAEHWHKTLHWLILCSFPLLGLCILRAGVNPLLLLLASAAGLWLDAVYMSVIEWDKLLHSLSPNTGGYDFGRPQIASGLYFATSIFGLLIFFPRLQQSVDSRHRLLLIPAWLILLGLLSFALIMTTSRAAWLSLLLVLAAAGVFASVHYLRRHGLRALPRSILIPALLCTLVVVTVGVRHYPILHKRITVEQDVIASLFTRDWDTLPYTSVGIRAHMLLSGWDKWRQRPFTGWGPAETKQMMRNLENEELRPFAHFHNQYLEILVRLGLTGFLLFMAILLLFMLRLWRTYRSGRLAADITIFLLGTWSMSLLWGMTSSRWTHSDWMFYWVLLAGISWYYLNPQRNKPAAEQTSPAGS